MTTSFVNVDIGKMDINMDTLSHGLTHDNIINSKLELCIGPMFAGKTKFLLEKINELLSAHKKFIVIKPLIDIRYNKNKIVSHDGISYNCVSFNTLNEINLTMTPEHILIDEGQFFSDLYDGVIGMLHAGKQVYVSGLNGDFQMNPMGDIIKLIPLADNIIYKQAKCKCGNYASYTSRIINNSTQILIGGVDEYIPTCKKCYCINNKKINANIFDLST